MIAITITYLVCIRSRHIAQLFTSLFIFNLHCDAVGKCFYCSLLCRRQNWGIGRADYEQKQECTARKWQRRDLNIRGTGSRDHALSFGPGLSFSGNQSCLFMWLTQHVAYHVVNYLITWGQGFLMNKDVLINFCVSGSQKCLMKVWM